MSKVVWKYGERRARRLAAKRYRVTSKTRVYARGEYAVVDTTHFYVNSRIAAIVLGWAQSVFSDTIASVVDTSAEESE